MEFASDQNKRRAPQPPRYDLSGPGLSFRDGDQCFGVPKYFRDHVIEPVRTFGTETSACLKLSYWEASVEDSPQASDPAFISASLQTNEAMAWRNRERSGVLSMLPFEGAHWRFEQPVTFVQVHVPFELMGMVCVSLYERELSHDHIRMPADVGDRRLRGLMENIRRVAVAIEPTNLHLDSWALLLAEELLRSLSTHGEHERRISLGKISSHRLARVIDYIEARIDQDLRLPALADIAAMSMYDFAHRFKRTIGVTPHAYVLSRRIARAKAMLGRRDMSLVQVALACGFSSQAHLTTSFHRRLGVTPDVYRQSVR